jgi:hypothetical protein
MLFAIVNLLLFWNWAGLWQWFAIALVLGVMQFLVGILSGWLLFRNDEV